MSLIFFTTSCKKDINEPFVEENNMDVESISNNIDNDIPASPFTYGRNRSGLREGDCDDCPELIINGDFSDVCSATQNQFIIPGCVEGAWYQVSGYSDVEGSAMSNTKILFTLHESGATLMGQSVGYYIDMTPEMNYCLSLDYYIKDIENPSLWNFVVYASNDIAEGPINIPPTPAGDISAVPNEYTLPGFFDDSNLIASWSITEAEANDWHHIDVNDIVMDDKYTQLWFGYQPIEGLTPLVHTRINKYLLDNISLKCTTDDLLGIHVGKYDDCFYRFGPNFQNGKEDQYTYNWTFGDGSDPSMESHAIHQYTTPGIYTVTLSVVDKETGCCATHTVEVDCEVEPEVCLHHICFASSSYARTLQGTDWVLKVEIVDEYNVLHSIDFTPRYEISNGYFYTVMDFFDTQFEPGLLAEPDLNLADYQITSSDPNGNIECDKAGHPVMGFFISDTNFKLVRFVCAMNDPDNPSMPGNEFYLDFYIDGCD